MKLIPLSKTGKNKGKYFAQVDDENYDSLSKWNWSVKIDKNNTYAIRTFYFNGRQKTIEMHREILCVSDSKLHVDHKDHDGLNNQRENIRVSTAQQNQFNKNKLKKSASIYKGLCYLKKEDKWHARIRCGNRRYFLGVFKNEELAAKAYDQKAKELFGEFAKLNFK